MEIHFWGTRGSIPAPGPHTLEFGGNTTCVEVVLSSGRRLVIDGGTGFRLLGQKLKEEGRPLFLHLLLTHGHWDHLLGIPFFEPIYQKETEIMVEGWVRAFQSLTRIFDNHLGNGFFPVAFHQLQAKIHFNPQMAHGPVDLDGAHISAVSLNHPQGGLGFRLQEGNSSLVFITDNELGTAQEQRFPEFVEFCQGCDLLIHDAQYLPEELPQRRGWGHSSYEEAVHLAAQAGAGSLLLTHHDPSRTDSQVGEIIARARELAATLRGDLEVDGAREGSAYRLPKLPEK
ncbi:MAG: MBL fold metallo-hydrolase [Thermodesulfobacteriota bacterium]